MNFQTLSLAPTNSTDALFRVWGSAVSTALAAVGLVKTTDTGQIDWTTVVKPTATSQSRGYEIWRFADALQATHPVFLRLDYGSGNYAINNPGLHVSIGTDTDGAGLLRSATGFPNTTLWSPGNPALPFVIAQNGPVFMGGGNDYSTTTLNNLYVASDDGMSFMVGGWYNAAGSTYPLQTGGMMLVERTRDHDGGPNGDGLFIVKTYATVAPITNILMLGRAQQYYATSGSGVPVVHGGKQGCTPTSGLVGSVLHTFPVFTGVAPRLCGPSKHLVALWSADQSVNSQFDVTVYGAAGTFRSLGSHSNGWANEGGSVAVTGAFRVA